jgi:hypothetical protein
MDHRIPRQVTAILGLLWIAGCAMLSGIPGLDSSDGRVYAKRCGGCHGTPEPRLRTLAEWHGALTKMDRLFQEKGLPPLSDAERESINRYLRLYAKQ